MHALKNVVVAREKNIIRSILMLVMEVINALMVTVHPCRKIVILILAHLIVMVAGDHGLPAQRIVGVARKPDAIRSILQLSMVEKVVN